MSVFLVILAILGGLLLLFGLLLLLRVGVQLRYDGSFSVKLKVLFLSFTLFPKKEKLRIKGQLPSEKKAKKEKKKKQECLCDTSCFFYILSRFQIHIPRIKSYMGTNIAIFVK